MCVCVCVCVCVRKRERERERERCTICTYDECMGVYCQLHGYMLSACLCVCVCHTLVCMVFKKDHRFTYACSLVLSGFLAGRSPSISRSTHNYILNETCAFKWQGETATHSVTSL